MKRLTPALLLGPSVIFELKILLLGLLILLSACTVKSTVVGVEVEMYKSPACECCGEYGKYLESKGFKVNTILVENPLEIKDSLGVPLGMRSCHTLKLDGYYVEGHVPAEAIQKLLTEQPKIDGIALPGMPAGSPGMPGAKAEPFIIYSISEGKISEYTRV